MSKFFVSKKEYEDLEKRYAIMENNYKVAMGSARQVRQAYTDFQTKANHEMNNLKTENRVLKAQLTKLKNKMARESVDNEQE